jgi:hypothetical protein
MKAERIPIIITIPLVGIALLTAIWTGWIRLGWGLPFSSIAADHGILMTGSFLGTVICIERVIVLKNRLLYGIPFLSGLSGIFIFSQNHLAGYIMLTLASLGLVWVSFKLWQIHKEFYLIILLMGAVCWLTGNLMLMVHHFYALAVPWWIAFFLLTVTAERIELTKFLPVRKGQKILLLIAIIIFLTGIVIPFHTQGKYLAGMGMIMIGLWLLRFDMARRAIKKKGLHRFSASLLISGYIWLLVSGILLHVDAIYTYAYDAILHSFFIGFVCSMIFAHAPIILPAVLSIPNKLFHPVLYMWGFLLQASLLTRVYADLSGWSALRLWSGKINGIVFLGFMATMLVLLYLDHNKRLRGKTSKTKSKKRIVSN